MGKKYIVSMALDCRADVEVDADSVEEAFKKANICDVDMTRVDIVGSQPVNCYDAETGELLKDY